MTNLKFTKRRRGEGSKVFGELSWQGENYQVLTGGYGKGAIPDGTYDVEVFKVVVGDESSMRSGFVNTETGRGWFIPLSPKFDTERDGFGIHPDGNKPGTLGCVGLQGGDIKLFWDKWIGTPLENRPTSLAVATDYRKTSGDS